MGVLSLVTMLCMLQTKFFLTFSSFIFLSHIVIICLTWWIFYYLYLCRA